jgi:hypothetical protein
MNRPSFMKENRLVANASELDISRTEKLWRALRDEDSFTLFYELTYSDHPVAIETLQKTFGASLDYIQSILMDLQRLGIVIKRGSQWTVIAWAAETVKAL